MSTDEIPLGDLSGGVSALGEGAEIGDKCEGTIVKLERRQQTDRGTNEPKVWNDGRPRMMTVITIQTADGELRSLFAKGGKFDIGQGEGDSMENAIVKAAKLAGADRLRVGDWLSVTFSGMAKKKPGGFQPAKLFTAIYRVDKGSMDLGLFSDED